MNFRPIVQTVLLSFWLIASLAAQQAQQQPQQKPQPSAEAEQQQALIAIQQASGPAERAALIEEFLKKYPDTQSTWALCRLAGDAFRQVNNYAKAMEYGERAVALNPQDPISFMIVADATAEAADPNKVDKERLAHAEQYARKALELLPDFFQNLVPPPTITPEEIEIQKKLMEAQPHATLGYIYLLRQENAVAETELMKALELSETRPNQVDYLRLGRVYLLQDKHDQAIETFRKAVAMGGALYQAAVQHLQAAEDAKARHVASANTTPAFSTPEAVLQVAWQKFGADRPLPGIPVRLTLHISDDPVVNAWAIPEKGEIYFSKSLIQLIGQSEGELAFVLAHEVGHVLAYWTAAGLEGTATEGPQGLSAYLSSVGLVSQSAEQQRNRYLQIVEKLADAIGFYWLKQAGYNPFDAGAFFGRLQMYQGSTDPQKRVWEKYLQSHPFPEDRIDNLRRIMATFEKPPQP